MKNTSLRSILFAFTAAIISGFAIFVNKFGVVLWNNPYSYTAAKNIVAALFLTGLIVLLKKTSELKTLTMNAWYKLVLVGLIGGSVPFLLFFKSLTMISAPEAAFIHKTLFVWIAFLSYPFLKERITIIQFIALGALFYSVVLLGMPEQWALGMGSAFALLATMLWAIESIIVKKMLHEISATTIGWARMFFGSLFILAYLALAGDTTSIIPSSFNQIGWAMAVGAILFVYVVSWYSALSRAPATIVSSVLVIAAPITAILDAIFVTHTFPMKAALTATIMVISVLFISKQYERIGAYYTKSYS